MFFVFYDLFRISVYFSFLGGPFDVAQDMLCAFALRWFLSDLLYLIALGRQDSNKAQLWFLQSPSSAAYSL